jgi:flagellar biosynthesis regulator FlbT
MEIDDQIAAVASSQDLMREIASQAHRFSTLVPGIINPRILENLYRLQTQKWLAISLNLLESVAFRVEQAARCILDAVCPPSGPTTAVRRALQDHIAAMHERATAEARKMLEEFVGSVRDSVMQTTDPMFREEVQLWAYIRSLKALRDLAGTTENPLKSCNAFFNMVASSAHKNIEAEIHDVTRVYYSVGFRVPFSPLLPAPRYSSSRFLTSQR